MRSWPLYLIRALMPFLIWITDLLLSQVQFAVIWSIMFLAVNRVGFLAKGIVALMHRNDSGLL